MKFAVPALVLIATLVNGWGDPVVRDGIWWNQTPIEQKIVYVSGMTDGVAAVNFVGMATQVGKGKVTRRDLEKTIKAENSRRIAAEMNWIYEDKRNVKLPTYVVYLIAAVAATDKVTQAQIQENLSRSREAAGLR